MGEHDSLLTKLLDLQTPNGISISGDGQNLVYATSLPWEARKKDQDCSVSSIWHAETGKAGSARQLTSGLYNDQSPAISPDGRTIAFVSDRYKQGESSAVYLLSLVAAGEPYPLTPSEYERTIEKIRWSPDGKHIAYLSADEKTEKQKIKEKAKDDPMIYGQDLPYKRLRLVHVATREIRTAVQLEKDVTDFEWHPDSQSIAFKTQRRPDTDSFWIHEKGFYIVSTILPASQPRHLIDFRAYVLSMSYVDQAVYFVGSVNTSSPVSSLALYKVDLTNEPRAQRVAHGEVDCARTISRVGHDLISHVQRGFEDELGLMHGSILLNIPNEIDSWDAAYYKDSGEIILAFSKSDINTPYEVYTQIGPDGAMVKLSNHGSSLADKQFAKALVVSCRTFDDTETIDGIFLTPIQHATESGVPVKPLATVLSVHGGPYSRSSDQHNPSYFHFVELLLDAGYAVLLTNYRGSLGRGENFAAKSMGGMGLYDQPDVVALTKHCIDKAFINPDEVIVSGWSQGGHMSYLCAVRNGMHGVRFKAAIPGAGVSDWDSLSYSSDNGYGEAAMAGRGAWTVDKSNIKNRDGSAIWEFKRAAEAGTIPPMLILHGEKDERVPIEQARAFRRALEHYNLPFEMVVYPRAGHVIRERLHLEDMGARFLRFCDQHLTSN